MSRAKWSNKESEITLEQVSKIIVYTLEGDSRKQASIKSDTSPFSVHKYRKIILES